MWDQFFTQERFGRRDIDISIIPWQNHRSIPSSFFNLIKNPTLVEVHDWIKAAERETWRHIPRIKSHCAEERTLDLCVQRLRRRVMAESNQRLFQPTNEDGAGKLNMNHSLSFPNLVCLGGLSVLDKITNRTSFLPIREPPADDNRVDYAIRRESILGLPGDNSSKDLALMRMDRLIEENDVISRDLNDSFANLLDSSEIFGTPEQNDPNSSVLTAKSIIAAPDTDATLPLQSPIQKIHDDARKKREAQHHNCGYIKTSNMANFYYRKSASHGNLCSLGGSGSRSPDDDKTYDQHSP